MAKSNISPSANNSFTHIEAKNSYADSVSTGFKHKYGPCTTYVRHGRFPTENHDLDINDLG